MLLLDSASSRFEPCHRCRALGLCLSCFAGKRVLPIYPSLVCIDHPHQDSGNGVLGVARQHQTKRDSTYIRQGSHLAFAALRLQMAQRARVSVDPSCLVIGRLLRALPCTPPWFKAARTNKHAKGGRVGCLGQAALLALAARCFCVPALAGRPMQEASAQQHGGEDSEMGLWQRTEAVSHALSSLAEMLQQTGSCAHALQAVLAGREHKRTG